MTDVSQWDPSAIAERAYDRWRRLDVGPKPSWSLDEWIEWDRLGEELLELRNRLEWLGLYRHPGGAS